MKRTPRLEINYKRKKKKKWVLQATMLLKVPGEQVPNCLVPAIYFNLY